jgi:hypothetical protein
VNSSADLHEPAPNLPAVIDREELERVLRVQQQAYALLRWLSEGDPIRSITFTGHRDAPMTVAAREWIASNLAVLPARCRPEPDDVDVMANLVTSMLRTSFVLEAQPRKGLESRCGCWCDWCTAVVDLPRLRTRKPTPRDKRDADEMMAATLHRAAHEQDRVLGDETAASLCRSPRHREAIATATWSYELRQRAHGKLGHTSTLVVWRRFAWTPDGAPKKDFDVTVDDLIDAEHRVAELVSTVADA